MSKKLKDLLYTKNNILLSTSSGSGLMEGSICSCTLKRAAVLSCDLFSSIWYKMGVLDDVPPDLFKIELEKASVVKMVDKILPMNKYNMVMITHN